MFQAKSKTGINGLSIRTEVRGNEVVPAIDIKMVMESVPVESISSACPNIAARFYDGDQVAVGEVNPLVVGHKLENLTVTVGKRKLAGCDIKKGMKIQLLPERVARLEFTVQAERHGDIILFLMEVLKSELMVSIEENQVRIEDMEQ